MKTLILTLAALWALDANAGSALQSAKWGNPLVTTTAVNGETSKINADWPNPSGQRILIWGIQADIWTTMFIPPGESMDAIWGPGTSYRHYMQSIADTGISISRVSDGMFLVRKGSDHYDNSPNLNANGPIWFPVPFALESDDTLHMGAFLKNGWQLQYGSEIGWNTCVLVYYTVGDLP